jgi:hypothetical protein
VSVSFTRSVHGPAGVNLRGSSVEKVRQLGVAADRGNSVRTICRTLKISRATLYRCSLGTTWDARTMIWCFPAKRAVSRRCLTAQRTGNLPVIRSVELYGMWGAPKAAFTAS